MKKLILTFIALCVVMLFSATPAWAADANSSVMVKSGAPKIAVINMQDLLQKLPQMKQIGDDLKKQFSDRGKKLTDTDAGFKKNVEAFNRDSAVMSASDKQAAEQKLMQQQKDLQDMQKSLMQDSQAAQNKAVDALLKQIKDVVATVAAKENVDVVLLDAAVAYSSNQVVNITDEVFQQMPKK